MSPQQSNDLVEALEQSKEEVLAAANIPRSWAAKKPAEGRWSALECLEHVVSVEESFLARLKRDPEAPAVDPDREASLMSRAVDRTEKRAAPDALVPAGRFDNMSDAVEAFRSVRERATRLVLEHGGGVTAYTATSPRWGVMNGREVLLLLAGHSRRHAAQIREAVTACELTETLEQSRDEVRAAAKVPDSLAALKPGEGRWSVLECLEHIVFVEERFLGRLAPAEAEAPPLDRHKESAIMARGLDRTNRVQAPEAIHPKGRFTSVDQALLEFDEARNRTVQFARENASKLSSMAVTHPILGVLNGKEALILIAAHARRHALQMRETAEAVAPR